MKHYDMIFIHPSGQISSPQFITMPMGVFSLMNELDEYDVKAVNVGLEMSLDSDFEVTRFMKTFDFDRVGIDLHWHEHAYSAIEIARTCKEINPDCFVVLGGLTASYFAEEILSLFECVDAVIAGEAEESLPLLLKGEEFSSIPNLVYRNGEKIKKTSIRPPSTLDSFNFSRMESLHHWEEYLKCNIDTYLKSRFWCDFWLCTGRGCMYDCSYCGGGQKAQKRINGRDGILFRSPDKVVEDLLYLQEIGVHVVNFSHDISLAGRKYWEQLLSAVKREGVFMGLYLEVWQLPGRDFIEKTASVWDPRFTTMVITLLSGSEHIRKENGKRFSNYSYYKCVEVLEKYRINHIPYFATGLPFETLETFKSTLDMTEKLLKEFNLGLIFCTPLRLDPGSPMYEAPKKYGIIPHYRSFADYYERCMKREKNLPHDSIGYTTMFLPEIMELQNQWDALIRDQSDRASDSLHFL